ncbi:hypothetical protein ACLOJK_023442 [Asimina triloba]
MATTLTPVGRGILGATLGETSSCSADEEIFQCPFDIEARALKILSDLLPVSTWETAVGLLKDLDAAKFEQVLAKETATKLLAKLDATKAERDEALDDAKSVILAKRDLERALEEATTEKLNAEASIRRLSDQGERAWEEASKLSSEVGVATAEVTALLGQANYVGAKEAKLLAKLEESYLRSDAYRQREEFERTHYAHGGFVKALLEDATLYPKLDLSSLGRLRVNFARGALIVFMLTLH